MFKWSDQRLRAWVIHLALASLLLAQSLGVLHRAVHWGLGTAPASASNPHHPQAPTVVSGLFVGHKSDSDCRLFDQLAHADLAPLPVLDVPCEFATAADAQALAAGHLPAPERNHCARGPPVLV